MQKPLKDNTTFWAWYVVAEDRLDQVVFGLKCFATP